MPDVLLQSPKVDTVEFKLNKESIVHYIFKCACRSTSSGQPDSTKPQSILGTLKQVVKESSSILGLGEPDYIGLYLKYYPIVTESFMLQGLSILISRDISDEINSVDTRGSNQKVKE